MKKPEEVKNGLECLTEDGGGHCSKCAYRFAEECHEQIACDALEYIQQLELDKQQLEGLCSHMNQLRDAAAGRVLKMEAEIDRQRDKIRVLELSLQAVNDGNAALQRENLMLEAQVPRWISVEERLPDKMKHVLVFKQRNEHASWPVSMWHIETDWRGNNGWSKNIDNGYFDITHWMPLPEPPKEDD